MTDWIHESRLCAEDEKWGAAVYALAMAIPDLAARFEEIMHAAYSEALNTLTLVLREERA